MKKFVVFLATIALLSSCVSKEKLTYLQDKSETKSDTTHHPKYQRTKYQVQPNDILNITIRSYDEETGRLFNAANQTTNLNAGDIIFYLNGYSVDQDGFIDMPVLGRVKVLGQNTEEIKALVQGRLDEYFKEDAAYVNVQLAGVRFSVVGDVGRPGRYVIYQNQVNIFEALATASDITMVGDRRHVQVIRSYPDGVKTITLDLTDRKILGSPDFFIQPNDIINVQPLGVKSIGLGTTGFGTFASILGVLASTATLIFTLTQINRN